MKESIMKLVVKIKRLVKNGRRQKRVMGCCDEKGIIYMYENIIMKHIIMYN